MTESTRGGLVDAGGRGLVGAGDEHPAPIQESAPRAAAPDALRKLLLDPEQIRGAHIDLKEGRFRRTLELIGLHERRGALLDGSLPAVAIAEALGAAVAFVDQQQRSNKPHLKLETLKRDAGAFQAWLDGIRKIAARCDAEPAAAVAELRSFVDDEERRADEASLQETLKTFATMGVTWDLWQQLSLRFADRLSEARLLEVARGVLGATWQPPAPASELEELRKWAEWIRSDESFRIFCGVSPATTEARLLQGRAKDIAARAEEIHTRWFAAEVRSPDLKELRAAHTTIAKWFLLVADLSRATPADSGRLLAEQISMERWRRFHRDMIGAVRKRFRDDGVIDFGEWAYLKGRAEELLEDDPETAVRWVIDVCREVTKRADWSPPVVESSPDLRASLPGTPPAPAPSVRMPPAQPVVQPPAPQVQPTQVAPYMQPTPPPRPHPAPPPPHAPQVQPPRRPRAAQPMPEPVRARVPSHHEVSVPPPKRGMGAGGILLVVAGCLFGGCLVVGVVTAAISNKDAEPDPVATAPKVHPPAPVAPVAPPVAVTKAPVEAKLAPQDESFVDTRGGAGWGDRCFLHIKANKLANAKAACERGLAMGPTPNIEGALLFNMGLIAEKSGDVAGAREAYTESLRVRPGNTTVQKALAGVSLAPAASAAPAHHSLRAEMKSFAASSFISNGTDEHAPVRAFDDNPKTAWNENAEGPGKGEWIEVTFKSEVTIDSVEMATGWNYVSSKDGDLFPSNAHLRLVRLELSSGEPIEKDVGESERTIRIDVGGRRTTSLRIVADEVFLGTRWQDLCISDVKVLGHAQ